MHGPRARPGLRHSRKNYHRWLARTLTSQASFYVKRYYSSGTTYVQTNYLGASSYQQGKGKAPTYVVRLLGVSRYPRKRTKDEWFGAIPVPYDCGH